MTAPIRPTEESTPEGESSALRKVTAIVRCGVVEAVEKRLEALNVPGISVTKVKGYGEYVNFFRADWMCSHARVEIFCPLARADEIARAICATACTGGEGDGIVAILPVEAVYRIRTCALATADELGGRKTGGSPD